LTSQGIKSLAAALALLVICCGLCTCGSVNLAELPPDDTGDTFEYAFMLYVEEIILPDVVYEDEDVYFQLRVSADANPIALQYLSFDNWARVSGVYALYEDPQEYWMIYAFVSAEVDPLGEPTYLLPVKVPSMPVGEWVCVIRSAADRSLGGKRYMYKRGDSSMGPVIPQEELQELRFTVNVIPRPED
jgi:hypothetical protein